MQRKKPSDGNVFLVWQTADLSRAMSTCPRDRWRWEHCGWFRDVSAWFSFSLLERQKKKLCSQSATLSITSTNLLFHNSSRTKSVELQWWLRSCCLILTLIAKAVSSRPIKSGFYSLAISRFTRAMKMNQSSYLGTGAVAMFCRPRRGRSSGWKIWTLKSSTGEDVSACLTFLFTCLLGEFFSESCQNLHRRENQTLERC